MSSKEKHFNGALDGFISKVRRGTVPKWFDTEDSLPDERNVPALGRIGDPDDILGSVRVEDGKVSVFSAR